MAYPYTFTTLSQSKPFPFLPLLKRPHLYPPLTTNPTSLPLPKKLTSFSHVGPTFRAPTITLVNTHGSTHPVNDTADTSVISEGSLIGVKPVKTVLLVLFWASVSLAIFAFSKDANACVVFLGDTSIKASSFGVEVAGSLRKFGWIDEVVVFALATLPVIELRGAIPVGYWMQLHPVVITLLSVAGNMVPVPFIILYLKKLANFLAGKNQTASRLMDLLFARAKEKAAPVEEFQWLGLMLFVAVPFPGTGAWTGAIIASILDMPFWSGFSANFFGVVLAGLLVNLLVNLGLKYAILTGVVLFLVSTFMWSVLRSLRKSLSSNS